MNLPNHIIPDAPLHVYHQASHESVEVEVKPIRGLYHIESVQCWNISHEVRIDSIEINTAPKIPGPVDAVVFADRLHKAPWGVISQRHPLRMRIGSVGRPCIWPFLNLTFYGRWAPDLDDFGVPRPVENDHTPTAPQVGPAPPPWGIRNQER